MKGRRKGHGVLYQLSSAASKQLVHAAQLAHFATHGGYLTTKMLLNLVSFDRCVIQHIMQEGSNDGRLGPATSPVLLGEGGGGCDNGEGGGGLDNGEGGKGENEKHTLRRKLMPIQAR